jgi:hypothetical protein
MTQVHFQSVPMNDKTPSPDIIEKIQTIPFNRGCFLLLAGGTLPVLFMNPLSYIFTLAVCYFITRALAIILF